SISGIGICVPGIYYSETGHVWAPNIPGWEYYPLLEELSDSMKGSSVQIKIDSDRACYILGETWLGAAKNSKNAIFMAIGTGIGAGIICDGRILRGFGDIAGSVGWMGLTPEYRNQYRSCGCFEYHASGEGILKSANDLIAANKNKTGSRKKFYNNTAEIFEAYDKGEDIAVYILEEAIKYWGRASANIVSLFNPEIIVFGGGVFGPASRFISQIKKEAERWAQPVSMKQVTFGLSVLGGNAGLAGAGRLALQI
ncbi:MAG: ROK family protein, partial [Bacteroidales bacterium]